MAKALRRRTPETLVYGIDPSDEAAAQAARDGVRRVRGLGECDIERAVVVFAAPLDATVALVESEARRWRRAALVTDVASLKAPVTAAVRRVERSGARAASPNKSAAGNVFVGAHPMCGSERSGYPASRAQMFEGAIVWLCPAAPAENGTIPAPALDRAAAFWRLLGGSPRPISAEAHDRAMSWASHLPQLTAWALAGALDGAGFAPRDLGPGGRDMTRLAGSSPRMWGPLLSAAAREDAAALRELEARIADIRRILESGDQEALQNAMRAGGEWHGQDR